MSLIEVKDFVFLGNSCFPEVAVTSKPTPINFSPGMSNKVCFKRGNLVFSRKLAFSYNVFDVFIDCKTRCVRNGEIWYFFIFQKFSIFRSARAKDLLQSLRARPSHPRIFSIFFPSFSTSFFSSFSLLFLLTLSLWSAPPAF